MTKVLITGGAGAIGSNLAAFLIDKNYEVVILDDLSSGNYDNIKNLNTTFIKGSILDDHLLSDLFEKEKFKFIFHLAAFFANQNSVDHPISDLKVNGMGILKILELSVKHNIQRFIYASSSCVYGHLEDMKEDAHLPLMDLGTPYAITKLLGEQYCQFFSNNYGLHTVCLRIFNAYGPGEKPGKYRNVIPNFIQRAMNGEVLTITGTGQETRDFTFVEDVVKGIYASSHYDLKKGEILNIGRGIKTTILELAEYINHITNNPSSIVFQPRRNWDYVKDRVANIEKASKLIDYTPQVSIKEGILKTYAWLLKNA